jgi:peptidoglycan hydrolase CwlO-like protein
MGRKAKVGIIFLVILLILSLAGAAIGFYFFQQEKYKVDALSKELENVRAEREYIEKKLAESRSEVKELNVRLEATQRQIDELNSELKRAESEKNELSSKIETLQSKLQQQEKIREEWRAKQTQTQKEIDNLQTLLNSLQENKEKLETQIAQLEAKKEVALGKIVVGEKRLAREQTAPSAQLAAPQAAPTLQGKVLVINRDYDFAVINLGRQQGIGEGDVFSVYHNNNYIGDIQVERVQETMSAFGFTTPDIENKITEGVDLALGKIASGKEKPVKEQAAPSAQLATPQAAPILEGRVLVINRDYNFAVINLGRQDGVSEADVFSVYHEDDYIGDIQVDKIQKNMGSCVFLTEEVKNKIREGDRVIRK